MTISPEIDFDELNIEIAHNVYLPIGQGGSAIFEFDRYGTLEKISGIFLSVGGEQKWFRLLPDNKYYKAIIEALEREWSAKAWDKTGATARTDYQEHNTLYPAAQL